MDNNLFVCDYCDQEVKKGEKMIAGHRPIGNSCSQIFVHEGCFDAYYKNTITEKEKKDGSLYCSLEEGEDYGRP